MKRNLRNLMTTVRRTACAVAVSAILATAAMAGTTGPVCTGDCDGDGEVFVDEILRGTVIALGEGPLSGCPSFDSNGDDMVTVDELLQAVDAALNGCATDAGFAFIVTTDFVSGDFGTISLAEPRSVTPAKSPPRLGADAVARQLDGHVYVVNRSSDSNIQVLDPGTDFATRIQCSTGERSNPQDIAFLRDDRAYVTRYGDTRLWIVDPSVTDCAGFFLGEIDLSDFSDADGLPEMDQMAIVGDRLYVSLQRLDQDNFFVPAGPGIVVVIDLATEEIVGQIELTGGNPFAHTRGLTVAGDSIVISQVGNFGTNDGGIERLDLQNERALGYFVTEEALGGDVTDFVLAGDDLGFAIVSLPDFTSSLVAFDPQQGRALETLSSGGSLTDIELNGRGELYVADGTVGRAGVRIFNVRTFEEKTPEPINLILPPFDILFVP